MTAREIIEKVDELLAKLADAGDVDEAWEIRAVVDRLYRFVPDGLSQLSKEDLKTVASDLGISTNGTRSTLCYRIANHLKA